MKKIYILAALVFASTANAATTSLGHAIAKYNSAPNYLIDAADAWDSLIGNPMRSGTIATRMSAINDDASTGRLYDVISVLAFNHTAMTIYQTSRHLDGAYDIIESPLIMRKNKNSRNFVVNARAIGAADKFEHNRNDNFEMRTSGAGANAYAYITDGMIFGVGYTYAKSKSHDMPLDTNGTSNIVSLFSKYLGESGWYINSALAAGQTQWDLDKTIVGVANKTSFNTDLYSAQISTGVSLHRGKISLTPEISTRYMRLISEKHADAAAQNFKKWWYNSLSFGGGATVGLDFAVGPVLLRPTVHAGAGYDIINHGTDRVSTRLITGQAYDMPVHRPNRTELRAGGGIGIYGTKIAADATYTLHSRSDYTAHEIKASIKITF